MKEGVVVEIPIEIIDDKDRTEEAKTVDPRDQTPHEDEEESVEELRDRWLRTAAELGNLQKRTTRKIEIARLQDRQEILGAFLEVMDSIERALRNQESEVHAWSEGLKAIRQQMVAALKRCGAEPIDAMGKPFDPNIHEAIAVRDAPDQPERTIIEVAQVGYTLSNGSLLRPAKVVVVQDRD